jgi:hypothetical protein|tara:strand:- start:488 stop:1333 length:846 start_codon:yes stop_codon:yes gene_type:complete
MVNFKYLNFKECLTINVHGYEYVFEIENMLRFFILDTIASGSNNWWETFKERHFAKQVEMVKKSDEGYSEYTIYQIDKKINNEKEQTGAGFMLAHDIFYTNLMDLHLIIKEYWNEFFREKIGGNNANAFYNRLEIVHRVRNKVMHSRPITNDELRELKNFKDYFRNKLNDVGKDYNRFPSVINSASFSVDLRLELKSHLEIYKSNIIKEFKIQIYALAKNEWWFGVVFGVKAGEFDQYYDDIIAINERIGNGEKGTGTKIRIFIAKKKMKQRCMELYDLNA